jgi:alpha-tubulin suppressor-like RCC1 family protein
MDQLYPKVVESLLGKDVRSVECGPSHTAAINADGELFTWGSGKYVFALSL